MSINLKIVGYEGINQIVMWLLLFFILSWQSKFNSNMPSNRYLAELIVI